MNPFYKKEEQSLLERIYNGRVTYLPKEMKPHRVTFENFGFTFMSNATDQNYYIGLLPEGWSLKRTENINVAEIIDKSGLLRGNVFYDIDSEFEPYMELYTRFFPQSELIDEENKIVEVYFGNKYDKKKVIGEYQITTNLDQVSQQESYQKYNELMCLAEEYGYEYYPMWNFINAYWDLEKRPIVSMERK